MELYLCNVLHLAVSITAYIRVTAYIILVLPSVKFSIGHMSLQLFS